jgi:hypothetical protein
MAHGRTGGGSRLHLTPPSSAMGRRATEGALGQRRGCLGGQRVPVVGPDQVPAGDLSEFQQLLVTGVDLVSIDPTSERVESPEHDEQIAAVGG